MLDNDTNFHGSDTDLEGYEDRETREKARNDGLIDRLSVSREGSECGPRCSHTAKCHGHYSGYNNLLVPCHYPCFHYECATPEMATADKLDAQRITNALLYRKYTGQVTTDPPAANLPLSADPPRCPDCLVPWGPIVVATRPQRGGDPPPPCTDTKIVVRNNVLCRRRRCRRFCCRHTGTGKFCCLRQVHLVENLPQATHTRNREKRHKYGLKHALHSLDGHFK